MKFRLAVVLAIFCVAPVSVRVQAQTQSQPDPAKIAQIQRLFFVMGITEQMPQVLRAMIGQMQSAIDSMSKSGDAEPPSPQFEKFSSLLRDRMITKMSALNLVDFFTPIYDKHYTMDDITALIAFYDSPVGRKTLQLQSQISIETMQALSPAVQKIMRDSENEIRKEHPELDTANDSRPVVPGGGGVVGGAAAGTAPPPPPPPPVSPNGDIQRINKGGDVELAMAIHRVDPVYPELARQAQVQGVVRLDTLIDKDGTVIQIKYVSGAAMLVQSAMDAVYQWRFKPTLLNGEPVQVECVFDINFKLGK